MGVCERCLHLNELPDTDLLKQMLKLSQEEGTRTCWFDFSLNKPADSLGNCVDIAVIKNLSIVKSSVFQIRC